MTEHAFFETSEEAVWRKVFLILLQHSPFICSIPTNSITWIYIVYRHRTRNEAGKGRRKAITFAFPLIPSCSDAMTAGHFPFLPHEAATLERPHSRTAYFSGCTRSLSCIPQVSNESADDGLVHFAGPSDVPPK